ncbi:hypothetical protein QNI19_38570 [Cytophagaceae bacterium DM2B3-1]|uniref:DUF3592 domain-containing protein n=1 Tax=Xanthocytophaga flava TaxID=3048013 RepID=A0ABT7CYZ9_9BACT|nr:hypothetical protein [Xanthocytophaga flavus]MDJ1498896.1 hypothetical protein [Xanthocytophaga flavus]
MKTRRYKVYWVVGVISFFVIALGRDFYLRFDIKYNRGITSGTVVNIYRPGKGVYQFEYIYNAYGIVYKEWGTVGNFRGDKNDFLNKRFPVIYSHNKLPRSEILVNPKDFDFFDIPIPDSLKSYTTRFY